MAEETKKELEALIENLTEDDREHLAYIKGFVGGIQAERNKEASK